MEQTGTVKLAKVLKIVVTIVFICNLIVLPLAPGVQMLGFDGIVAMAAYDLSDLWGNIVSAIAVYAWQNEYAAILAVSLFFYGTCTAIILWQARDVLGTIVKQDTFTTQNAKRMKVTAICMFLISVTAFFRMVWEFCYLQSIQPLFTYNTLSIPVFLVAGLLCMVMSALFRQAAELKEENDLTI